jgi:hypothetical protein
MQKIGTVLSEQQMEEWRILLATAPTLFEKVHSSSFSHSGLRKKVRNLVMMVVSP